MQSTNQPGKFLVPFAQNDSAKVEIPVTSSDASRASQALGFPPLTGMPPEAGGVPPQLEDFNGAVNQIARIAWWMMQGGGFPFDAAFAADSNIAGYAQGSLLPAADRLGAWYSIADGNSNNPDTNGTNWAPGYHYGTTSLVSQTGGTTTLTPAQAAKRILRIAGTLTSNLTVVVPTWVYDWRVHNATAGAFTVTVKTAAGVGVVIPQNNAPTLVYGDGTNILAGAFNVPAATQPTQALQLQQATGRLLAVRQFTANATYTPTAGTNAIYVEVVGGGGGGGGAVTTGAGQISLGAGGAAGGFASSYLTSGFSGAAIVVGAGGAGQAGDGVNGATSSFGAISATGGGGGGRIGPVSSFPVTFTAANAGVGSGGNLINSRGGGGQNLLAMSSANYLSGGGGRSYYGDGGVPVIGTSFGNGGTAPGCGGSGASAAPSNSGTAGGSGANGKVTVWEYA